MKLKRKRVAIANQSYPQFSKKEKNFLYNSKNALNFVFSF